jgi:hypothetical protein
MSPRTLCVAALAAALVCGWSWASAQDSQRQDQQQQNPGREDKARDEAQQKLRQLVVEQEARTRALQADLKELIARLRATEKSRQEEIAKFTAELARLLRDLEQRAAQADRRNEELLTLRQELNRMRERLATAQAERDLIQNRSRLLEQRVRELETALAKRDAGQQRPAQVRDPNQPNPPPVFVKGAITKIDQKDGPLVVISVGSDAGLAPSHTLEVYRLKPTPQYLGMVRVMEVSPTSAVARLVGPRQPRTPLQVGDEVTSRIETPDDRRQPKE